jgi:transcriptional regulator GlxA family with amidase domain
MFALSPVRRNVLSITTSSKLPATEAAERDSTDTEVKPDRAPAAPIQDLRLRKLLELMEVDPRGTIQTWALTLNLSHSHLQHLFKQATGRALGRALTEKRLQKAAQLLANTNLSIKEIACAVGYEHTSSFTRAFERRYEHAPRRYRMRKTV